MIIAIVIEIIAFGLSKAQNTKEIQASFIDTEGLLDTETSILNAIDSGESGYYIILPETINNKFISSYLIADNTVLDSSSTNTISIFPGEKIYLTDEEAQNAQIDLQIVYDTEQINDEKAYHKQLEEAIGNKEIVIDGYMSSNAEIEIPELGIGERTEIEIAAQNKINTNAVLNDAFSIQSDIPLSNLQISIIKMDQTDDISKYRLIKVNKTQLYGVDVIDVEGIEDFGIAQDKIVFDISTEDISARADMESAPTFLLLSKRVVLRHQLWG